MSEFLFPYFADVTSVFKKGDKTDESNYRPTSTLSIFSKIFEKLIYRQVNSCMEPKLSKKLGGFCQNHNTQHVLVRMIESRWALLNKRQKVGAIIMYLSKAFDTLSHKLLLKKLQAYRFIKKSLCFIESYFNKKKQRTKLGDKYQRIFTGVPQGSILRPLFFNIFIKDLFITINKSTLCNYVDDNIL